MCDSVSKWEAGKKDDLLQVTVETKIAFYALRGSLEILTAKKF